MKKLMRVPIVLICLSLSACCSVNAAFVKGVDSGTSVILPRYVDYIKNDANLDEDSKKERIRTVDKLRELIEEAKKQIED